MTTQVAAWVQALVTDVYGPSSMAIGAVIEHPDGRTVKVLSGRLWGSHGLSNHWTWSEVRADGTLGPVEHGYGW